MSPRTLITSVALTVGLIGGPLAGASWGQEAAGGKIAFTRDFDIWVMNEDGTDETNLTNSDSLSEADPQWSPDGSKIAFSAEVYDDGWTYNDIFVMNADGSDVTNITNTPREGESQASWAPDGSRIAYSAEIPGEVISPQSDIFTMNPDGTDPVRLTFEDYEEITPAWSPNGDKIAFTGVRNGDWEILTMNPDGTGEVNLTDNAAIEASREDWAPDWSPDGTMLVFMAQTDNPCCGNWEIWAMNADGSGQQNLTNDPAGDTYATWSPDGSQIIFQSNRGTGWTTELWVMPSPLTAQPEPAPAGGRMGTFSSASLSTRSVTSAATGSSPQRLTYGGASAPDWHEGIEVAVCDIVGTSGADKLTGTSGADVICGGGGNDTIAGGRGADTILGAGGGDKIVGGRGADTLKGGRGADHLDAVDGVNGNDFVTGGRGIDTADADQGDIVKSAS